MSYECTIKTERVDFNVDSDTEDVWMFTRTGCAMFSARLTAQQARELGTALIGAAESARKHELAEQLVTPQ